MTNQEWKNVNEQYIELVKKGENRTEVEELRYSYLDKIITVVNLTSQAKRMGNKHPEENFLIKNATQKMREAEQKLRAYLASC